MEGSGKEPELLASCYRRSLEVAIENGVKSIAFPNISTGVYGYPKEKAADIAIQEVESFLQNHLSIEKVIFAVFDDENYLLYKNKLA